MSDVNAAAGLERRPHESLADMSYTATVHQVMIASPSDVASERAVAREVLSEWNAIHAGVRRMVLMPLMWETHASPEMGDRPQAVINRQVLSDADLLIGVFWTRLGTPTGEFASGTVEEIEKHLAADKPAMLYFSDVPVRLESVDDEQYAALKTFRRSCMDRGLCERYSDLTDFRNTLYRQLQLKLNEHPAFKPPAGAAGRSARVIQPQFDPVPFLGKEAQTMLKAAAGDSQGRILHLRRLGGSVIQTGGQTLLSGSERRLEALWEAALEALEGHGLVKAVGNKREIFEMTQFGYEVADQLAP
jgi:hypothetical protein